MWKLLRIKIIWVVVTMVTIGVGGSAICTCNSCETCESRLEDPACSEVRMTRNIEGRDCIAVDDRANVLFNCGKYDIASENDFALWLKNVSNFTAKDCDFTFDEDVVRIVEVHDSKDVVLERIKFDGNLLFDETQEWGAELYVENSNVTVRDSTFWQWGTITHRSYSIHSVNSNMTIINNRVARRNFDLDFHSEDWKASKGWNNMCQRPGTWNDTGTIRCKYWDWGVCRCWNCSDCNFKLTDAFCNRTDLTNNITAAGSCFVWGIGTVLNGNGFVVRGNGWGQGVTWGRAENITIDNFWIGFWNVGIVNRVEVRGCGGGGIVGGNVEVRNSKIKGNGVGISVDRLGMQNTTVCGNGVDLRIYRECLGEWRWNTCETWDTDYRICHDNPPNPVYGDKCYRRCTTVDPANCETNMTAYKEYYIRDLTNVSNCFNITNISDRIAICLEGGIDGRDVGYAFRIINSTNITVRWCNITQFFNAVEIHRSRNITIRDGEIHHIRRFPLLLNHSSGEIRNITFYENTWARGYKNISSNFTFRDCAIIINPWCIDDPICTAALIGIIIAGLWVYYRRRV